MAYRCKNCGGVIPRSSLVEENGIKFSKCPACTAKARITKKEYIKQFYTHKHRPLQTVCTEKSLN